MLVVLVFTITGQANATNPPTIKQVELSPDRNKMLKAIENNYYAFAINLKNIKIIPLRPRSLETSL